MDRKSKLELIVRLKKEGYRLIPGLRGYYINETGNVVKLFIGKPLKGLKGRDLIRIENEIYNIPKLMLSAFRGQPYRKQKQINYIDGNRANLHLLNVRYATLYIDLPETIVNDLDFMNAIRCYIQVSKRYNRMDHMTTQIYLRAITDTRCFFQHYVNEPYISVFEAYLFGFRMNIAKTAKAKGMAVRDCSKIVRFYLNKLVQDILHDIEVGKLVVLPYQPRKKSLAQVLKEYNVNRKELGLPPLIPPKLTKSRVRNKLESLIREIESESESMR